jgi:hypothetical protein
MFTIQDFKIGDRVKVRKGRVAYEGEVAHFSKGKHIFILVEDGTYRRALPHWVTEIVDVTKV